MALISELAADFLVSVACVPTVSVCVFGLFLFVFLFLIIDSLSVCMFCLFYVYAVSVFVLRQSFFFC